MAHIILGVETSCDETAAAVYSDTSGLLSNIILSQDIHEQHGGVVPELASRDHMQQLLTIIQRALKKASINKDKLTAIAYTAGPGLAGCLMVGATMAKSLAWSLNIPAIGVNHLEGHILAPQLENPAIDFPFLALLVSGGHTQLVHAHNLGKYDVLGQTIDDAVGEAFDKVAKLLGLGYPGGAKLSKLAATGKNVFNLPIPMANQDDLNFSFSGLKTAVYYATKKLNIADNKVKANLACSFEQAAVSSLVHKTLSASQGTGLKKILLTGGVSANKVLRAKMLYLARQHGLEIFYATPNLCTDNAAMIAYAGSKYLQLDKIDHDLAINIYPRWSLKHG